MPAILSPRTPASMAGASAVEQLPDDHGERLGQFEGVGSDLQPRACVGDDHVVGGQSDDAHQRLGVEQDQGAGDAVDGIEVVVADQALVDPPTFFGVGGRLRRAPLTDKQDNRPG